MKRRIRKTFKSKQPELLTKKKFRELIELGRKLSKEFGGQIKQVRPNSEDSIQKQEEERRKMRMKGH